MSNGARGRRIRSALHFPIFLSWYISQTGSNMATKDRASRQRYIANAISICGPISKEGNAILYSGVSNLEGLQGDAAAFLYKHSRLFFRPTFGTRAPKDRKFALVNAFPQLSRELEILPSGINVDTCKALENLEIELSAVCEDQWTANVLGSVISSAAHRLFWRATKGARVDNPETAVYDLLKGAIYGCSDFGIPWLYPRGDDEDPPLSETMALFGKEETIERMRVAQEAIWDHLEYENLPKQGREAFPSIRRL